MGSPLGAPPLLVARMMADGIRTRLVHLLGKFVRTESAVLAAMLGLGMLGWRAKRRGPG